MSRYAQLLSGDTCVAGDLKDGSFRNLSMPRSGNKKNCSDCLAQTEAKRLFTHGLYCKIKKNQICLFIHYLCNCMSTYCFHCSILFLFIFFFSLFWFHDFLFWPFNCQIHRFNLKFLFYKIEKKGDQNNSEIIILFREMSVVQ